MTTIAGFPDPFDARGLKVKALMGSAEDLDAALTRTLKSPQVSTAPPEVVSQLQALVRTSDGFEANKAQVNELGRLVGDAFLDDVETTLGASWQKLQALQARLGIE